MQELWDSVSGSIAQHGVPIAIALLKRRRRGAIDARANAARLRDEYPSALGAKTK